MRKALICEPVRTPIGRYGGALRSLMAVLETAENLRRTYDISREEQDRPALRSHHRGSRPASASALHVFGPWFGRPRDSE